MPTLHKDQQDAINSFVDDMIRYMRSEVDEVVADASDDELRSFIRKAVQRAALYGIDDSYLIQQYLTFMAWVGEDFDTNSTTSWAADILNHKASDPETKIQLLENYIMTEWNGAQ